MVLTLADASATLGPVFKATGALSCSGSAAILLTGYLFPHLVRDRLYMKLLLMISFSDMLGSLAFALGYMQQPELCALQGGAIIFFFRATWMWTLALSYQLYALVMHKRVTLSFARLNAFIWPVNLLLELLPLYLPHGAADMARNVEYGTDDAHYGNVICSLQKKEDPSAANWAAVGTVFAPLCLVLAALTYQGLSVFFHYRHLRAVYDRACVRYSQSLDAPLVENLQRSHAQDTDLDYLESEGAELGEVSEGLLVRLADLSTTLSLYPMSLFVCWLPLFLLFLVADGFRDEVNADGTPNNGPKVGEVLAMGLASLHGSLLALIFFLHSPAARANWARLLEPAWARLTARCRRSEEGDSLLSDAKNDVSFLVPQEDNSVG